MSHDIVRRAFGISPSKEATAQQQQDSVKSFGCKHCVLIFKTRVYLYEHLHQVHGLSVEAALGESGLKSLPQIKPKADNNRLKAIKSDFAFNCKHCSFKSVNWSIFNEHKKQCSGNSNNESPKPKESVLLKQQKSSTGVKEANAKTPHKSTTKDVKIYSKSPQSITKYFTAAPTLKSDVQSKEKKAKTLRLEGSSLKSCGVFQVTATSIDLTQASGNNRSSLLNDLISDPTSAKPVDPFKEATLSNTSKRTPKGSELCRPPKKAKIELDQSGHTQTSNCAELSFEFSDDEEKDLVDQKAETIKCKHCDFQSASMEIVYSHYEENHPYLRYNSFYIEEKSDQSATFRCLECPIEFSNDANLRNHYSKDHPNVPDIFNLKSAELNLVYKCFACPFTSSILQSLREHQKENHPSQKVENPLLYCKYSSPPHSFYASEKRLFEAQDSLEMLHPERTTSPCLDQRSPTVSPKSQPKAQDGALYYCVKCLFSHKSVVVMHVHYKKCHPEEPISLDKIKQSIGAPSIIASAQLGREIDLSHAVEKETWADPLSSPEHILANQNLPPSPTSGLENSKPVVLDGKLFFCELCNFSSANIKNIIAHHSGRHGIKTTIEEVLRQTSVVQSNWEPVVLPNPQDLYYCHICNVGNSSMKGLLNHQNKAHVTSANKEVVLEYSAMIHDQIEKSKSNPTNSILPCGLPLPLNVGKSVFYFCYGCNFRNKDLSEINRHFGYLHGGGRVNPQKTIEHTAMIYGRSNVSFQIKPSEVSFVHAENKVTKVNLENAEKVTEVNLAHAETNPTHALTKVNPIHAETKVNPIHAETKVTKVNPIHAETKVNPTHAETKVTKVRKSRHIGPSQEVRLECFKCSYASHHIYLMRKHIIYIHQNKMSFSDIVQICGTGPHFEPGYYCDICPLCVENETEVKKHCREKHGRGLSLEFISTQLHLSPDNCHPPKRSRSSENDDLQDGNKHNTPQTYPAAYSCKACPFKGTSFSSITSHYQTVHPSTVKEGDSKTQNLSGKEQKVHTQQDIECYQEPLEFGHFNVPKGKAKGYSCPYCPAIFEVHRGLITHLGIKHQDKVEKVSQLAKSMQIFKCCNCSYVNNIRSGVLVHTKAKHPTKGVKCDSFFIEREQLNGVKVRVKNGHWKFCGFMCKECSQIYPSKERMVEHRKTHKKPTLDAAHVGSKPMHEEIWCQYCGLYCATSKVLSSHLSVCQKNSGTYACALCPAVFSTKVQLGIHYSKKHGEKAFFEHYAPLYNQPSSKTPPQKSISHGPVSTKQLNVFKCPSCRYVNSSAHGTLTHCQMRHPNIVVRADRLKTDEIDIANMIGYMPGCKTYGGFRCKKCPLIYRELKKLKKHCEIDHSSKAKTSSQLPAHTQEPPEVKSIGTESASSCQPNPVPKFRHFFTCSMCAYSTSILKTLGRHYRKRHGKTAYCKFYSPLFHQSKTKPNVSVTFEQTRKTDVFEKSESTQLKVTPQVRVYKCSLCPYSAPYRRYLVAHFKNRHKFDTLAISKQMERFKNVASTLPTGQIPCKKCANLSFVSKERLLAHYDTVHSSEVQNFKIVADKTHRTTGVFRCLSCKQKIFGIKNIWNHLDAHRERLMKKQKELESKNVEASVETRPSLFPAVDGLKVEVKSEDIAISLPMPSVPRIDVEEPKQQGKPTCLRCKKSFMSLRGLRSHERSHAAFAALDNWADLDSVEKLDQYIVYKAGTTRPYMCKICRYRSDVMGLCKSHFLRKHRDVSRSADADKNFKEENQPIREVAKVMNNLNVDGEEGPESSFLEPPDVQRQLKHYNVMAQVHPGSKTKHIQLSDPRMLPCEMCNFNCQHYANMRRHYLRRHGKKLIRCKDCSFFTCSKQNMDLHEQMGHSCVQSEPTHLKNLCCPFCLYQSKNKNNMIDHIVLHREERVMPIEVRRSKLSRYLQGVVFRCYKCTFTSGSAESLDSHMAKHSDIKPFKCRLCYFDCTQLRDLEAHLCDMHQVVRNHQLVGQVSVDQLEERREGCNSQDDDDYIDDDDDILHNPQNDQALENDQPNKEMAEDAAHPIKEKENHEGLQDEIGQFVPDAQIMNEQNGDEDQTDDNELQVDEHTFDQASTNAREISESSEGLKEKEQSNVQDPTDADIQKEESVNEHVDDSMVDCAVAVDSVKDANSEMALNEDTTDTGKDDPIPPLSEEPQMCHEIQDQQSIQDFDSNPKAGHTDNQPNRAEDSSPYGEMPVLEKYFKEQHTVVPQHCKNSDEICTGIEEGSELSEIEDQETQNPPMLLDFAAAVPSPVAETTFPCELCGRSLRNTSELQRHMMRHGM